MPTTHANGVDLYYEIHGEGPPLTLIMGLACTARQWNWMLPALQQHFKVITFDARGVGRSDKPDEDHTTELFADDVAALLTELGIDSSHVFGVSMGGMVAQQVAIRHPERVQSLVLGCTMPAFGFVPPTDETIGAMAMAGSADVPAEVGVAGMLELFLSPQFKERDPATTDALRSMMEDEKREQWPDHFMHQFAAMGMHDVVERIGEIKSPTLVLTGDQDPVVLRGNADKLLSDIEGAQLHLLPGVWHAFWVEAADDASRAVIDFLR